MQQLANFIEWLSANAQAVVIIQQALCVVLSGVFELAKLTKASKIVGTIAALDLGRIIRKAKAGKDVAKKAGLVTIALLLAACSAPAAGSSGAVSAPQVAQVAVAAIAATDVALAAAIDQLPKGTDLAPWEARVEKLEQAAELVRGAEATAEDVCQAATIAAPIADVLDCAECVKAVETIASVACKGGK